MVESGTNKPKLDADGSLSRNPGESWNDYVLRSSAHRRANNQRLHESGRTISKDPTQWSDVDRQAVGKSRATSLGYEPLAGYGDSSRVAQEQNYYDSLADVQTDYDTQMSSNWSPDRQGWADQQYNAGNLTYGEYMEGAHDAVADQQGNYQSQGNVKVGYRPDGSYGWMDMRDNPGWTQQAGVDRYAPSRQDLNVAHDRGYDVSNMGQGAASAIAGGATPPPGAVPRRDPIFDAPQQQPQQQQQWGSAPQGSMAGNYGWGAGLGGPPQQQQAMPQWGPPQQQQAMPQWSQPAYQTPPSGGRGVGQMGVSGGPMPQWGGAPQQQAMPQWGQMMQQQPMGGPMAGMEAARMGGGAMQQMGGGSPWASMWGNPFAGRQMTTDPSSPAMGGLPQMDPAQQLLMQMQGMGGGGLSGGFGAGGGSSGGGGASGAGEGAYQTPPSGGKGVGQTGVTGGDDPYGSLASILALFAGGGAGSGGGGGAAYNPMYGGLPRNGLYYADLMRGAGG